MNQSKSSILFLFVISLISAAVMKGEYFTKKQLLERRQQLEKERGEDSYGFDWRRIHVVRNFIFDSIVTSIFFSVAGPFQVWLGTLNGEIRPFTLREYAGIACFSSLFGLGLVSLNKLHHKLAKWYYTKKYDEPVRAYRFVVRRLDKQAPATAVGYRSEPTHQR